jgi:hypothetical protein
MGIPTLIKTLTASGDSSLSFVDGTADVTLDSTYDEYMFVFTDIGPATDAVRFEVQFKDSSSNSLTKTSATFMPQHSEDDSVAEVAYNTGTDLDQQTSAQHLTETSIGNGADESMAGIMHLFSPASTTYVKHFYSQTHLYERRDRAQSLFVGGYVNSTAAVTQAIFSMSSGNFDGVIQLFGIS